MGLITNFYIRPSVDSLGSYFQLTDKTTYPISDGVSDFERDEIGIALFWSDDNFTTIKGSNLANSGSWIVDAETTSVYEFQAFACENWSDVKTYDGSTQYLIVYLVADGKFYKQTGATASGQPGTIGATGWTLVTGTSTAMYAFFEDSFITKSKGVGYNDSFETPSKGEQTSYSIANTECHKWKVTKSGSDTESSFALISYAGVILDDELVFDDNDECTIDLDAYDPGGDGAYIVYILSTDGSNETEHQLPIYDFCDAEECYRSLFKYIMCACDDPCDEDCNENMDVDQRRSDLILIEGILNAIEEMVFMDKSQYIGIYSLDSSREEFIAEVGGLIEKLKIIVTRCGMCSDDDSNDVTC